MLSSPLSAKITYLSLNHHGWSNSHGYAVVLLILHSNIKGHSKLCTTVTWGWAGECNKKGAKQKREWEVFENVCLFENIIRLERLWNNNADVQSIQMIIDLWTDCTDLFRNVGILLSSYLGSRLNMWSAGSQVSRSMEWNLVAGAPEFQAFLSALALSWSKIAFT